MFYGEDWPIPGPNRSGIKILPNIFVRLIRITTNYPVYLQQFYAQHASLYQETYAVQYQMLMADCFGWADFWTHALRNLGYEVWEPIGNAEAMQKSWAIEHGISYHKEFWISEILTAQIKFFQPDVIFVDDCNSFDMNFIRSLRGKCQSIKLIIGWCASPFSYNIGFKVYDIILSSIPPYVAYFQKKGHHCEYMRHAFEPRILPCLDRTVPPAIDFSFIGSIVKAIGFHLQREQIIRELLQETVLQIWGNIEQPSRWELRRLPFWQLLYDIVKIVKSIPGCSPVLKHIPIVKNYTRREYRPDLYNYVHPAIYEHAHPPLFGIAMYQQLYNSKITLNIHGDNSSQFASNIRLYEATGVGSCLLTEWQMNLHESFVPEDEVVTYWNVEEAIEKVKFLLTHEQERQAIGLAGQQRTLRDHTFAQRAIQLDEIIRKRLKTFS